MTYVHWLLSAQSQLLHLSDMLLMGLRVREIDDELARWSWDQEEGSLLLVLWRGAMAGYIYIAGARSRSSCGGNPIRCHLRRARADGCKRGGKKKEGWRRDAAGWNQRSATRARRRARLRAPGTRSKEAARSARKESPAATTRPRARRPFAVSS